MTFTQALALWLLGSALTGAAYCLCVLTVDCYRWCRHKVRCWRIKLMVEADVRKVERSLR